MSKPLFILLGCGHVAKRHLEQITTHGTLVAVCDTDKQKAKALATQYKVPYFTDSHTLFQSGITANIVVICTPNALHAQQATAAMRAGYHVLVEKPMALQGVAATALCATAKATGKHVFTVLQNRFNSAVQQLKQALEQQLLGKPYSIQITCFWNREEAYYKESDWKGKKGMDGGALFTQCSHFIDLACWLLGPISNVHALLDNAAKKLGNEGEDTGIVTFLFENGVTGSLHFSTNSYAQNMEGAITLLAEKGTVKIGGPYLDHISYQQTAVSLPEMQQSVAPLHALYDALMNTLLHNHPNYAPPEEVAATIVLIERIYAEAHLATSGMPAQVQRIGIRNVQFGEGVKVVEPVNLYGCSIGAHSFIGPFVEIQDDVQIGEHCRIQSHSFICSLVTLGHHCFIGHGVMFVNDTFSDGGPAGGDRLKWKSTHIGNHVSIGSNATILPVSICDHVVIGAGAVVTKDITNAGTYAGNPAQRIR